MNSDYRRLGHEHLDMYGEVPCEPRKLDDFLRGSNHDLVVPRGISMPLLSEFVTEHEI